MAVSFKVQIPPPSDYEGFQNLCEDLAKEFWRDPTAYSLGTQGHKQFGIDIVVPLANENGQQYAVAIQCKKKKRFTNRKLSKADIDQTISLAAAFSVQIKYLVIATVSAKDPNIQLYVTELNQKRVKSNLYPIVLWFWDDIERRLQEECQNTYLQYLTAILPENARASFYNDLLIEALSLTDQFFKDNYVERALGAFSVLEGQVKKSSNAKVKALYELIEVRKLLHADDVYKATSKLEGLVLEYPDNITFITLLYDRYFQLEDDHNQDKTFTELTKIFPDHPLAKNIAILRDILAGKNIDTDVVPHGTSRENFSTYNLYYLYSLQIEDKNKSAYFLNKLKEQRPNSAIPYQYEIIYSIKDTITNAAKLTSVDLDRLQKLIETNEAEISKRDPLPDSTRVDLLLEKMRLDIATLMVRPSHVLNKELKDEALNILLSRPFERHSKFNLIDYMTFYPATRDEVDRIVSYIKPYKNKVGGIISNLIFSNALFVGDDLSYAQNVCSDLDFTDKKELLNEINDKALDKIMLSLKRIGDGFIVHMVLSRIDDQNLVLELIKQLEIGKEGQELYMLTHLKIVSLMELGAPLTEIKNLVSFDKLSFRLLNEISRYAQDKNFFDVAAECFENILSFDLSDAERADIVARLMLCKWKIEDYPEVVNLAKRNPGVASHLITSNRVFILNIVSESADKSDDPDFALENLKNNQSDFGSDFRLYHLKAGYEIKAGNFKSAYDDIVTGLRLQTSVSREMFRVCYMQLIDIANSKQIETVSELTVKDGCYVKISGMRSWFYLGEGEGIDAVGLKSGEERYNAIIGKHISEEITWPVNGKARLFEFICGETEYLHRRSNEAIMADADEGGAPIWAVTSESPEATIEELKALMGELDGPRNEFFNTYKNNLLPFALLAKVEGGVGQAMDKIRGENEGFIHVNDNRLETINEQISLSKEAINGEKIFIDATSALLLIHGNMLEMVCKNTPNLYFVPSVISQIREYASRFAESPNQMGRMSFTKDNRPYVTDYDYQKELGIRRRYMAAAELLENSAKKDTSSFLLSKTHDFETNLPTYITDPFAAAKASKVHIISEDCIYSKVLSIGDDVPIVASISSLSYVEALYEEDKISYDLYLEYVEVCNLYRCKSVIISAEIIKKALFGDAKRGIINVQPRNIRKLMLGQTLSSEYGVNDDLAASIIAGFVADLIKDPSITYEHIDAILPEFFVQVFQDRGSDFGDLVMEKCSTILDRPGFIVVVADRDKKTRIAYGQINKYFSEANPLHKEIPLLLSILK